MKKILSATLLAASITASAQEMHFEGVQGIFNTDKAVSEISNYEVKNNAEGVPTLYVKLWNGAEYSTPADNVTVTTTNRSTPSLSSEFNSLKYIVKDCSNIDNLEFGDFIGVANDEVYDIDGFVKLFYTMMYNYGTDPNKTFKPLLQLLLATFAEDNSAHPQDIRFHSYSIIYVGADPNGNKIPQSARLIYPYSINEATPLTLKGFYVDNHCTVQQKGNEPSNFTWAFSSAPCCVNGFLSIMPDLVSFGASAGYSQQFIDKEINGSSVAYSIVATQQFVNWQKDNGMGEFIIAKNPPVINTGTSQGATSALAGTYFIENKLDKTKYDINLYETHLSSGAYDMKLCMDWFAEQDNIVYSVKVPIFFMGLMSAHHDMLKSPTGQQYYINDYFSPRSAFVYTDANGKTWGNIWQVLDTYRFNGEMSVAHTCSAMAFYGGKTPGANPSIHNMLASDIFTVKDPTASDFYDSGIDWDCDKMRPIKAFIDRNNLTSPFIWKPKSPIKLYATNADDMIPVSNTTKFYMNMFLWNNDIHMELTNDVPNVFGEQQANYGAHMAFCMVWYLTEITGLPVNVVNEALKALMNEGTQSSKANAPAHSSHSEKMEAAFAKLIECLKNK